MGKFLAAKAVFLLAFCLIAFSFVSAFQLNFASADSSLNGLIITVTQKSAQNSVVDSIVLDCPLQAISSDYSFSWTKAGFSSFYIQFSFSQDFKKGTVLELTTKNASSYNVSKKFKTLQSYAKKNPESKVFARVLAKQGKTVKATSNVCGFRIKVVSNPVTPLIVLPQSNQTLGIYSTDFNSDTINWLHPTESDFVAITGTTDYNVLWVDEDNYFLIWQLGDTTMSYATIGTMTVPSDAVYKSTQSGCEAWYAPQESYNRANTGYGNQNNYGYAFCANGGGTSCILNLSFPSNLCIWPTQNMSTTCTFKQQKNSQCGTSCSSSQCSSYNAYGSWQTMCPSISETAKYNSREYYYFSCGAVCYPSSRSFEDQYIENCNGSCTYGVCSGGPTCTNECSSSGQKRCNGSYSQTCGNYDSDSCLEWNSGDYCSNGCNSGTGQCSSCTSHTSSACYNNDLYWYNSCNQPESIKQDCGDSSCSYGAYYCSGNNLLRDKTCTQKGCSNNACFSTPSTTTETSACQYGCSNSQCIGSVRIKAVDLWENPVANASVFANGALKGKTDASGYFSFQTQPGDSGKTYSVNVKTATGTDCGTHTTIIDFETDKDEIYYTCNVITGTLNAIVTSNKTSFVIGETINFSISTKDSLNNPVANVLVGVFDPIKQDSPRLTTNSLGTANYSTTADRAGTFTFWFSPAKDNYNSGVTKIRVDISTANQIIASVLDSTGNPLDGAEIYLDSSYKGKTTNNGKLSIPTNAGQHSIEAKTNNQSCGTKNINVQGTTSVEIFCAVSCLQGDSDCDGWSDTEEAWFGSDPTNREDDFCIQLQKFYDESWATKITINAVFAIIPQFNLLEMQADQNVKEQQTTIGTLSSLTGSGLGVLVGVGSGFWDDLKGLVNLPGFIAQAIVGLWNIATNQRTYIAIAEYEHEKIMKPVLTRCQTYRKGFNFTSGMAEGFTEDFRTKTVPTVFYQADSVNFFKKFNIGDNDDKANFNYAFTSAYFAGYMFEQVVLFGVVWDKATAAIKTSELVKTGGRTIAIVIGRLSADARFGPKVVEILRSLKIEGKLFDQFVTDWSDEAQDGLGYIAKNTGQSFTMQTVSDLTIADSRVVSESVGYGIRTGAAKEASTTVKGLTEYSKASWKQGFGTPFNPYDSKHTLVKLYESPQTATQIGNTTINTTAVLKQGEHLGPNSGFGLTHMRAEGHIDQIKQALNLSTETEVFNVIDEVLKTGEKIVETTDEMQIAKTISRNGIAKDIKVIVSKRNPGSIQTGHPFTWR